MCVYGGKSRWGGGGVVVYVCVCVCGGGGVCGGCTEVRVGWEGVVVCVLVRVGGGRRRGGVFVQMIFRSVTRAGWASSGVSAWFLKFVNARCLV